MTTRREVIKRISDLADQKLPEKLSDAIELALEDLAWCEKNPKYRIGMGVWHDPSTWSGQCEVCLAGSVLAHTLEAPAERSFNPFDLRAKARDRIAALDAVRVGNILGAVEQYTRSTILESDDAEPELTRMTIELKFQMPSYEGGSTAFKKALRSVARRLRKLGY